MNRECKRPAETFSAENHHNCMLQYQIDPQHTGAMFKVRHMMISWVKGTLGPVAGTVQFDPNDPAASKIDVSIPADSISTGDSQRDADLKSANFFDVAK